MPINTAKTVAQQLIADGTADHAYIGIKGGDLTPAIADTLNLDVEEGAIVQGVTKGSPADEAGLQAGSEQVTIDGQPLKADGDVITEVDGEKITGMDDLVAIVNTKQPGDEIDLTVYRDGDTQQIPIHLAQRPEDAGN